MELGSNGAVAAVPGVIAVDHVGLAVVDLDQAVAFYSRAFGMVEVHREVNEEQGVAEVMLAPAGQASDAQAGDAHGPSSASRDLSAKPTQVQLLAPLRPDSAIGKFLDRSGAGIQQVAYRVSDIDAVCEHLRSQGIRLLYETPRGGTAGSRINFVHPKDAMGVLVELVEPAASS